MRRIPQHHPDEPALRRRGTYQYEAAASSTIDSAAITQIVTLNLTVK